MYSEERLLRDGRLGIFSDEFCADSFIAATSEVTFARLNRIGGKWCVWLYKKHIQRDFSKMREALAFVEEEFIGCFRRG